MQDSTQTSFNWFFLLFPSLVLALVANALWLGEIFWIVGWEGFSWISHLHYSVFVIALLAVVAYVLPFRMLHRTPWIYVGQAILEIYPATLIAFFLAKTLLFSIHTQFFGYLNYSAMVALLIVVVLLISFSIHLVTSKLLRRVRFTQGIYVAVGIMLALPLSFATIRIFPAWATSHSFVDAVKMGYPFFWIVLLMGFLGIRSAIWTAKPDHIHQEDILDDFSNQD